jgi:hypothetical protein
MYYIYDNLYAAAKQDAANGKKPGFLKRHAKALKIAAGVAGTAALAYGGSKVIKAGGFKNAATAVKRGAANFTKQRSNGKGIIASVKSGVGKTNSSINAMNKINTANAKNAVTVAPKIDTSTAAGKAAQFEVDKNNIISQYMDNQANFKNAQEGVMSQIKAGNYKQAGSNALSKAASGVGNFINNAKGQLLSTGMTVASGMLINGAMNGAQNMIAGGGGGAPAEAAPAPQEQPQVDANGNPVKKVDANGNPIQEEQKTNSDINYTLNLIKCYCDTKSKMIAFNNLNRVFSLWNPKIKKEVSKQEEGMLGKSQQGLLDQMTDMTNRHGGKRMKVGGSIVGAAGGSIVGAKLAAKLANKYGWNEKKSRIVGAVLGGVAGGAGGYSLGRMHANHRAISEANEIANDRMGNRYHENIYG